MTDRPGPPSYSPREILLAAAAQAVLAAFRDRLETRRLPATAIATLRVLESALEPYRADPVRNFPYDS